MEIIKMILKVNTNANFKLAMKADIFWESKYINILVILDNLKNGKRFMKQYKANNFDDAINQYNEWEQMMF